MSLVQRRKLKKSKAKADGKLVSRARLIIKDLKKLPDLSSLLEAFAAQCQHATNSIDAIAEVFKHYQASIGFLGETKIKSKAKSKTTAAAEHMRKLYSVFEDLLLVLIRGAVHKGAVAKAVKHLIDFALLKS